MRVLLSLFIALVSVASLDADDDSAIGKKLKPVIQAHEGKIAVAVKNLATGEYWGHQADEVMPTASLIKVAIMVEAHRQADAKAISLKKTLTLREADKVPGAGILKYHFSAGATFSLKDAMRLMMVYSDNTATNMVLDVVGIENVNNTTKKLGFTNTKINAKVYKGSTTSVDPSRTKKYGLGSTTANEMLHLFALIHDDKAASKEACLTMRQDLEANEDKELLVRDLPVGTRIAHKTGAVSDARTDCGIIDVPNPNNKTQTIPVIVCVLTTENKDQRWILDNAAQVTIGKIGRIVYDDVLESMKK